MGKSFKFTQVSFFKQFGLQRKANLNKYFSVSRKVAYRSFTDGLQLRILF